MEATMNEEMLKQLTAAAERLATAAESLDHVLDKLDAQQEALNAKVDRIVAAVEDSMTHGEGPTNLEGARSTGLAKDLGLRVAELEKSNADLTAQASRLARKTLSPVVAALIAKEGIEGERLDPALLNKTLAALSVEQRIAVKSELARAGMID